MYEALMNNDKIFNEFVYAILKTAVDDYMYYGKTGNPKFHSIERFFQSSWYHILLNTAHDRIYPALQEWYAKNGKPICEPASPLGKYIKVFDIDTGKLLASGTRAECASQLKMSYTLLNEYISIFQSTSTLRRSPKFRFENADVPVARR